jgi:conjugal transfer ATP-binding protein TraC
MQGMDFNVLMAGLRGQLQKMARGIFWDDLPDPGSALERDLPPSLASKLPYLSWDSVHQLYQQDETVGLILEVTPLGDLTEAKHDIIAQIFNDSLPEGLHVQIINWSSPKVGWILDRWAKARAAGGGVFVELAQHRREHLKSGVWSSMSRSAPMFVRDYRIYMAFELKGSAAGEAGKALHDLHQTIDGTFKSLGGSVTVVRPNELLSFLRAILNPTSALSLETPPYDPELALRDQAVARDTTMTHYRERLTTSAWFAGDAFGKTAAVNEEAATERFEVRTFSAERYPEICHQGVVGALIGDFFNAQLQPMGSNLTVLYFSPWSYDKTKSHTELKAMRASQQAAGPTGKFFPNVALAAADWDQANVEVSKGARLCEMALFVASLTPLNEGEKAERYLKSIWANAGFGLSRNDVLHLQTLIACLPLTMGQGLSDDFRSLQRLKLMPTSCMALLAPLQGETTGCDVPHMLLLGRKGQPFFWSPFANEAEGSGGGNHNVSVIGSSGSGKSVFMQDMAGGLRGAGAHVMVLDDGRSFENTCRIQQGQFIEFTLNSGLCLNPFSMFDHGLAATDEEYKDECREAIRALVLQMARGSRDTSKEEIGAIAQSVNAVWEAQGADGDIDSVANHLEQTQGDMGRNMKLSMSEYIKGGSYFALYNGQCSLSISNPFTVFELSPIESKKELRASVILGLLMLIRQRMKHGGRSLKKALFIDEAWQLLGDGAAGPYIEGFARRCRKEGGALITGTQSLSDYQQTAGGRACINNSDWNVILRLKEEAIAAFEKEGILQASAGDLMVMRSLRTSQGEFSEAFIRGPAFKALGRLVLDRFSLTLYSTKPDTLFAVQSLIKQGLAVNEAVRRVAFDEEPGNRFSDKDIEYAQMLLGFPPIKKLVDDYLGMSERDRRTFIRNQYRTMGLKDADAA